METIPKVKKHRILLEIFTEFLSFRSQYSLTSVSDCEASIEENMSLSVIFYGNK